MWVLSQNKEPLVKVDNISIKKEHSDSYDYFSPNVFNIVYYKEQDFLIEVGSFTKLEKAKKVFNDMKNHIKDDKTIYEIPKEYEV